LRYCAYIWFYYRNILRRTDLQLSNFLTCQPSESHVIFPGRKPS